MTDWTALERIAQDSLRRGLTQMALHPSNFLALLAELREAQAKARDIGIAATYEENRLKAEAARLREQAQEARTHIDVICQQLGIKANETSPLDAICALQGELAEARVQLQPLIGPTGAVEHWRHEAEINRQAWLKAAAERDAAREALRQAIDAAYDTVPSPAHEGACGPESHCDAICAEAAGRFEQIRRWRSALGQPTEPLSLSPNPTTKE